MPAACLQSTLLAAQLVYVTVRVASFLVCKAYSSDAQVAQSHMFQETLAAILHSDSSMGF